MYIFINKCYDIAELINVLPTLTYYCALAAALIGRNVCTNMMLFRSNYNYRLTDISEYINIAYFYKFVFVGDDALSWTCVGMS